MSSEKEKNRLNLNFKKQPSIKTKNETTPLLGKKLKKEKILKINPESEELILEEEEQNSVSKEERAKRILTTWQKQLTEYKKNPNANQLCRLQASMFKQIRTFSMFGERSQIFSLYKGLYNQVGRAILTIWQKQLIKYKNSTDFEKLSQLQASVYRKLNSFRKFGEDNDVYIDYKKFVEAVDNAQEKCLSAQKEKELDRLRNITSRIEQPQRFSPASTPSFSGKSLNIGSTPSKQKQKNKKRKESNNNSPFNSKYPPKTNKQKTLCNRVSTFFNSDSEEFNFLTLFKDSKKESLDVIKLALANRLNNLSKNKEYKMEDIDFRYKKSNFNLVSVTVLIRNYTNNQSNENGPFQAVASIRKNKIIPDSGLPRLPRCKVLSIAADFLYHHSSPEKPKKLYIRGTKDITHKEVIELGIRLRIKQIPFEIDSEVINTLVKQHNSKIASNKLKNSTTSLTSLWNSEKEESSHNILILNEDKEESEQESTSSSISSQSTEQTPSMTNFEEMKEFLYKEISDYFNSTTQLKTTTCREEQMLEEEQSGKSQQMAPTF